MEASKLSGVNMVVSRVGGRPFHLPPFARCFVASVNEELHLVLVVLGNVPVSFKQRFRGQRQTPSCERPSEW